MSHFNHERKFEDKEKSTNNRLVGLKHGAQQPRLSMEADEKTEMKASKRMEAAAEDGTNGDIS